MTGERTGIVPARSLRPGAIGQEIVAREFLAFGLADEDYALPLNNIREIRRMPPVTEVPRGPREVLGIISVRGDVTTLVDMRRKLEMPEGPVTSRTRVLLVDQGDEVFGLLVDRVLQVHRLSEDELELASVLGADTSPYVMGIGRPATAAGSTAAERPPEGSAPMLILLDPIALLKGYR